MAISEIKRQRNESSGEAAMKTENGSSEMA
jgi:hypothetical protein